MCAFLTNPTPKTSILRKSSVLVYGSHRKGTRRRI